ncbi:MAG: hypothetical protein ACOCU4_08105 [Alkalispirochaeta sp.]
MDTRLPIALREKYGLVHVPGQRRCHDWATHARNEREAGLPVEQAGLTAAHVVFPYEAASVPRSGSPSVEELLTMAAPTDSASSE